MDYGYRRPLWERILDSDAGMHAVAALILLFLCGGLIWVNVAFDRMLGIGGFGPVNQYSVTVISKHIDAQKDSSSYMVTTDHGVFEVDNGPLLDVWNADVIYGSILPNQNYCFTAKGNTVTTWYAQQYPYIQKVVPGECDNGA